MQEVKGRRTFTLDTIIKCANCKKEIRYGDSFSSLELRNKNGRLSNVCGDCSKKECERMEKGALKWENQAAKRH